MSQPVAILVLLLLLVPLWNLLRKDFISGLAYAVVVVVAGTPLLAIKTPGGLPELTLHRLFLLTLLVAWARNPDAIPIRDAPLRKQIFFWLLVASVSLVGTIDFSLSLKRYLDYVLDIFAFYFVVVTSLRTKEDVYKLLRAACLGLAIVAVMATLEKYTRVNLVDRYVAFDAEASVRRDVRATYRHRILLGTGMAMGWPLGIALLRSSNSSRKRTFGLIATSLMIAGCYFATSRGPWLASGLAAATLFVLGSSSIRKPLILLATLAVAVLLLRPGVLGTLVGFADMTSDADSFKGGTYRYRLELWRVAATLISDSPWRTLFGIGPGAGAGQTLNWTLSYRGNDFEITSWDNDLAYSLYQYGWVGLLATALLYGTIPLRLLFRIKAFPPVDRDVMVCVGASTLALFFMMSNVMIFARQIHYLLWIMTAAGLVLRRELQRELDAPQTAAETPPNPIQDEDDFLDVSAEAPAGRL